MADQHAPIDLRTLEQVQHLLATTTFASIDDLARRTGDPAHLADALGGHDPAADRPLERPTGGASGAAAPLPRRR
jgi:hypothetical protein